MTDVQLLSLATIAITVLLLLLTLRRHRRMTPPARRALSPFDALRRQVGRAVESGRRLHVTLGRATLSGLAGPTSAAALGVLDYLAHESGQSGVPPVVTVGEATLLPASQGTVRRGYEAGDRRKEFRLRNVHFVAPDPYPMTYAAGVSAILEREEVGSNVAVGRFGSEIGVIAEAGSRRQTAQIMGSDDPTAIAVALAYSENVLWGEELFAAGAYLEESPIQLASLRTQDLLRWLLVVVILGAALLRIGGIL